jgi:hypothetical protein
MPALISTTRMRIMLCYCGTGTAQCLCKRSNLITTHVHGIPSSRCAIVSQASCASRNQTAITSVRAIANFRASHCRSAWAPSGELGRLGRAKHPTSAAHSCIYRLCLTGKVDIILLCRSNQIVFQRPRGVACPRTPPGSQLGFEKMRCTRLSPHISS